MSVFNNNKITDVESLCRLYSGKHVTILIPGGNRGDGLIYIGAKVLLDRNNVQYKEVKRLAGLRGDVLLIYGCGGYAKAYGSMPRRIMPFINNFKRIYILPSSFDTSYPRIEEFISKLPSHVLVFCRERISVNNVKKYIKYKNNVRLDHDTALHFNYDLYKKKGNGRVLSYRRDRESKKQWFGHKKSIDASYGNYNTYKKMIDAIINYDEVVTDRAHVMILAGMLGKKTHVLPSNYFKIKGIYDYSFKDKKNIIFHNDDSFLKKEHYKKITLIK